MRDRERERQREKQAPYREPDVGLDPGTLGSRPGPKAGAKPLSHPGIPHFLINPCPILQFPYTILQVDCSHFENREYVILLS